MTIIALNLCRLINVVVPYFETMALKLIGKLCRAFPQFIEWVCLELATNLQAKNH